MSYHSRLHHIGVNCCCPYASLQFRLPPPSPFAVSCSLFWVGRYHPLLSQAVLPTHGISPSYPCALSLTSGNSEYILSTSPSLSRLIPHPSLGMNDQDKDCVASRSDLLLILWPCSHPDSYARPVRLTRRPGFGICIALCCSRSRDLRSSRSSVSSAVLPSLSALGPGATADLAPLSAHSTSLQSRFSLSLYPLR